MWILWMNAGMLPTDRPLSLTVLVPVRATLASPVSESALPYFCCSLWQNTQKLGSTREPPWRDRTVWQLLQAATLTMSRSETVAVLAGITGVEAVGL